MLLYPRTWMAVRKANRVGLETLIDYERLEQLRIIARRCLSLPGDYIELGSYRGGSAGVIGLEIRGSVKTLHVCDSFSGMPAEDTRDNFHRAGDFADTDVGNVTDGLQALDVPFRVHKGFFSNTFETMQDLRFAFAHIDADMYQSVKEALNFVYLRTANGGVIVFDDYGAPTCEGARAAVDEFFARRREKPIQLTKISYYVRVQPE